MNRYIRFIVTTDHPSRTKCTGVVTSLRILTEEGDLPNYSIQHAYKLFEQLNKGLPCPPFQQKQWSSDCICWFKDTKPAQKWIQVFREMIEILKEADLEVSTLTTKTPGMIVYEDEYQVVAKSREY